MIVKELVTLATSAAWSLIKDINDDKRTITDDLGVVWDIDFMYQGQALLSSRVDGKLYGAMADFKVMNVLAFRPSVLFEEYEVTYPDDGSIITSQVTDIWYCFTEHAGWSKEINLSNL